MKNNRLIALFLCVCMLVASMAVLSVSAEGESLPFADGDKVVISCPSEGLEISATLNEYTNSKGVLQRRLEGVENGGAVFTVDITDDGIYFIYDGKYLTSGETGSNLTLEETASEYSLWALEEAEGGWYIKNLNAVYTDRDGNEKPQYIEYYYAFTTYSMDTSNAGIYTFQFDVQKAEEDTEEKNAANLTTDIGIMYVGAPGQYEGVTTLITTPGTYSFTWDKAAVFELVAGDVYKVLQVAGGSSTAVNLTIADGQFIVSANGGNDWPSLTQGTGWWTGGSDNNGVPYDECPNFCTAHIGAWFNAVSSLQTGAYYKVVGIDLANPVVDSNYVVDYDTDPSYGYVKSDYVTYSYLTVADYKDCYTYADGVNNGTIQERGEEWADKPASDFWYLVQDAENTVTVNFAVDGRTAVADDTKFRIWIDADPSDTDRTTLYDFKVDAEGKVYDAKHPTSIENGYTSVEYTVAGDSCFLTVVLDKTVLGIDGEYGICLTLGQSGSTQMHSIEYDAVTGSGQTYAPWTTTEFYEIFGGVDESEDSDVIDESDVSDGSGTPVTGDAGIYVVVAVMLVAMAGVAVVYRRRRA